MKRSIPALVAALLLSLAPLAASAGEPPVITPTTDRAAAPEVALTTAGVTYSLVVGEDVPVWFRFRAARDAVAFVTLSSGGGTVYEQGVQGLTAVGSISRSGGRPMTVRVRAGGTYFAEVQEDPYGSDSWPASGRAELTVKDMSPVNDTRAAAITLPSEPSTKYEPWLGWALDGAGDPSCGGYPEPATMWYRFDAPAHGVLTTKVTAEPGWRSSHALYRLDRRDELQPLACYPNRGSLDDPVVTRLKRGRTYYVMVEAHRIPTEFTASSYNYYVTVRSSFAASRR